ncbi:MAG TPA: hypothetical protein VMV69_01015 [Pirellulales bacterium]|nr:hypothetical protein [Pirellulales bacterium]
MPADRYPRSSNQLQLAKLLETMAEAGYTLILDEFQYFNRKGYEEFCSYLQAGRRDACATTVVLQPASTAKAARAK